VQVNNGSKIFYLLVVYSLARIEYRSCRFKAALFAGLLCSGCSTPPQQSEMPLEPPPRFTQAGGDQAAPDRWWQSFDDPHLTSLMERALNRNFTLRAAWARLRQAEAAARREGASLWPTLDAQGSVTRQDSDTAEPVTTRQVALAAAYEIDLWGRLASARKSAARDVLASREELEAAAMLLSAQTAKPA
jgi:outer membrane protein TolC